MITSQPLRWATVWHAVGAAMVLFITVMSLSPSSSPILVFSVWDKLLHFIGYAGVGAWYVMVVSQSHHIRLWIALVCLGIALELLQGFVPGRATEGLDAVANTLGATAGTALGLTPWRNLLRKIEHVCRPESRR